MKKLKTIYKALIILLIISACTEERSLDFLDAIKAPENVAAVYTIAQDNTGLVTITPIADGASSFDIHFGDATVKPENIESGKNVQHTYLEGTYNVTIVAYNAKGDTTEATQELIVSFKAPQNLVVTIENDAAISKKVNVTATADFASMFEFHSGEDGVTQPVATANIGDALTYQYTNPGTYSVKVIAKGGAIETTEYTVDFEVTEILIPIVSAPNPPTRGASDVISIFSEKYTQTTVDSYTTSWSSLALQEVITVKAEQVLAYRDLNYAGIITEASPMNASGMEFVHFDVWTTNVDTFKLKFVDFNGTGYNGGADNIEFEVENTITEKGKWLSFDIPLSEFTGVPFSDINQTVISAAPQGTVFIDNFYFYKASTTTAPGVTPIHFETDYELSSFDGGNISVVANPDTNGNSSSMVAQLVKNAGQPWAGSKITVTTPFNVSNTTITAKVWSPRAGLNLLLKFEDATPWPNTVASAEITATTTVANGWEELTFDFSGISTSVDFTNLVLIMDNGTEGDGSSNYTIYVDDISTSPKLDFEPDFELSSFDGGNISVVSNPDTNGNSSLMVAQLVKNAGQPWAGSKITVPSPFTFSGGTSVKVKVWSPRVGLNLLLKFEDATPWPNTIASAEITATTTIANGWEELTFDFSGISTSVDFTNLVLIMDNGTEGDGSSNYTIFIDDISQF